jgi:hypothetical protein
VTNRGENMLVYKLTDENNRTYNKTQWGEGVSHETSGEGELCDPGWLHAYTDPRLAIIMNPIHANFQKYNLWEAEGEGKSLDDYGLKIGFTKLTTLKQVPVPEITLEQKVKFAILCALKVYTEKEFVVWANKWLSGEDRSEAAASAAADAAVAAACAVADAACAACAVAAYAAARAARAAAYAGVDASARAAAYTAEDAARTAAYTAEAAARAAAYTADAAARAAADAASAADARAADADAARAARAADAADAVDAALGADYRVINFLEILLEI